MKTKYLIVLMILLHSCKKEVDIRDQYVGFYKAKILGREAFLSIDSNQNRYVTEYKDSLFGYFNIVKSEYPDSMVLLLDSNLNFVFLKTFDYKEQMPIQFVLKVIQLKADTCEYIWYKDLRNGHSIFTRTLPETFILEISQSYHTSSYTYELIGNKLY